MRVLSLVILSFLSVQTWADDYRIDSTHTYAHFSVDHLGFSLQHGRFDSVSGQVTLDFEKKVGAIDVSIATQSLSSGDDKRDRALKGASFFNVERFPVIRFVASKLEWTDEYPKAIHGELTLLGERRPFSLYIRRFKCGFHLFNMARSCGADAYGSIKRSDFGMNAWLSAVGDDVEIELQVEAIRQ